MTCLSEIVARLRAAPVTDIETAAAALGCGRTLAYANAREHGQICEGIAVIRVGRRYRVPTRPILELLGFGYFELEGEANAA